ncbi:MAG: SDR family oxidoreductase [Rhodospirillaceae bacterium]|nr:SDR family oxidoreductase [Rhodospirillaceae bacterium]
MIARRLLLALAASLPALSMPALAADGGVLVFGGNRATGLEVVKSLVAKGDKVTVFVRPTSDIAALKDLGVATVAGDALNVEDVNKAFASGKFRAVVSSLGGRRGEPRPDYEGTKNIADAAKAAGVSRMVIVTAIGTGDSVKAVSEQTLKVLGPVYAEKVRGEDYVKASGLTYTIIRPGGLRNDPPTGNGMLTEDITVGGDINRSDLGRITADAIDDAKTFNKVYSAVDKNMIASAPMVPRQELAPRNP